MQPLRGYVVLISATRPPALLPVDHALDVHDMWLGEGVERGSVEFYPTGPAGKTHNYGAARLLQMMQLWPEDTPLPVDVIVTGPKRSPFSYADARRIRSFLNRGEGIPI